MDCYPDSGAPLVDEDQHASGGHCYGCRSIIICRLARLVQIAHRTIVSRSDIQIEGVVREGKVVIQSAFQAT